MLTKRPCSLAAEVALNRHPAGLKENHHYRYERYRETLSLNAFIAYDAQRLHGEIPPAKSTSAPLFGLPFSCKDNINASGFATTAGTPGLADFLPEKDAPVVARLIEQGAVLCGKNNMHELSFGVTSCNGTWGTVGNPAHPGHLAGGSSGGCAAAVAAGACAFAVGTDTGGSVRIPASLCGLSGFRPTTGRYSSAGIVPVSHTRDTPGFIAPGVSDIVLLDAALMDETPVEPVMPRRVGIPAGFLWQGLDSAVEKRCREAVARLEEQGVEVVTIDDSHLGELNASVQFAVPFYEFFIDFPRFLLGEGLEWRFQSILDQLSDAQVRNLLQRQLQQCSVSWDDYLAGLCTTGDVRTAWQEMFSEHQLDVLLYPTVSCAVPRLTEAHNPAVFEKLVRNTDLASSAGAPSLTLPVGRAGELSIGLSVDGLPGEDRQLMRYALAVARLVQA